MLRVVQITDPHLGPFMSVARLRQICAETIILQPDLVLLTGDFHTPESDHMAQRVLAEGLAPLQALPGRCFACLGNHDIERDDVLEGVKADLEATGVQLLVDETVQVPTAHGPVQVVGLDWAGHGVSEGGLAQLSTLQAEIPALVMLHNPEALDQCDAVASHAGILAFCGHTHGGLLGLLSLGASATLLSLAGLMDHGMWGLHASRAYVHRAQGFRALSCNWVPRLGVPAEYSVLHIAWAARARPQVSQA